MFKKVSKAYKKYKERKTASQDTSTSSAVSGDDSAVWDSADSSQHAYRTSLSSAFKRKGKSKEGHVHSSSDPTPLRQGRYYQDLVDSASVIVSTPVSRKLKVDTQVAGITRAETWEKALWKEQPFPDNYTDQTFLKELVSTGKHTQRT